MKKRILRVSVCVGLVLCLAAGALAGCGEKNDRIKTALDAKEYIDYASSVYINSERYPELAQQGLFMVTGFDEENYKKAQQKEADAEGVIENNFDPEKGILVIINGLQIDFGRAYWASMCADSREAELNRFGSEGDVEYFKSDDKSDQIYDMSKYWFDNGYNVFYFHYEKFSDHINEKGATDALGAPFAVCDRIWTRDSGAQAVLSDNTLTEPGAALNGYSVAEYFAAEYLRAVGEVDRLFPSYKDAQKNIACAGHSMGGALTVAGNMLLNLLAESGAVNKGLIPDRLELMDSYVGIGGSGNIAWSGNPYINGQSGDTYVTALEQLTLEFGVAAVFYSNKMYMVPFQGMTQWNGETHRFEMLAVENYTKLANRIIKVAPVVVIEPKFAAVGGSIPFTGHNAIREWVLSSILYDAPTVTDADGNTFKVPTAAMTDDEVKAARGSFFDMTAARSVETVRCDDDVFTRDVFVPAE